MQDSDLHVTCITTGRADYSLLRWPMYKIADCDGLRLSIIAGGGHLATSQGATISEIEQDGFQVDQTVEMYLDSSTATGPAVSAGLATMGVAQALGRLAPDWVVLLGDRFEVLGAATAAALHRIPVCHLCGGDVTEEAYDDAFRHAITKLSHLHCTSTDDAAQNVLQMGEEPWRVVNVGSPGLDALHNIPQMSRADVFTALGLSDGVSTYLITLHPTTLKEDFGRSELHALLAALDELPDAQLIFTGANADTGGAEFNAALQAYVAQRPSSIFEKSLGQTLYFNTVRQVQAVIGNSSSGLYEIPSLSVPTINIGDRQKGRLRATSVFDCAGTKDEILASIHATTEYSDKDVVNPYGDGHSAAKIVDALRSVSRNRSRHKILAKRFNSLR